MRPDIVRGAFSAGGAIAIGYVLVMVFTAWPPEGVEHIMHAFGLR